MSKNPNLLTALPKNIFCKMLNNKSELTNWAQNTKQINTNWHQNSSHKSSKNPIFVVRKWAPQEVVLFLTLEVVPKLTLERPKRGTKTNSPAYIYRYICVCVSLEKRQEGKRGRETHSQIERCRGIYRQNQKLSDDENESGS